MNQNLGKGKLKLLKQIENFDKDGQLYEFFIKHNDLTLKTWKEIYYYVRDYNSSNTNDYAAMLNIIFQYYNPITDFKNSEKYRFKVTKFNCLLRYGLKFQMSEDMIKQICEIPLTTYEELFIQLVTIIFHIKESEKYQYIIQESQMRYKLWLIPLFQFHQLSLFNNYLEYIMKYSLQYDTLDYCINMLKNNIDIEKLQIQYDSQSSVVYGLMKSQYPIYQLNKTIITKEHVVKNPLFYTFLEEKNSFIQKIHSNSIKSHNYKVKFKNIIANLRKLNITQLEFQDENAYQILRCDDNMIEILYSRKVKYQIGNKEESDYLFLSNPQRIKIFMYNDMFYYQCQKAKQKSIPLTLKIISRHTILIQLFKEYLTYLSHKTNNLFLKEFACMNWENLIIPLTLNEVIQYHNWNELFHKKYKATHQMKYNFNKHNPNFSYLLIKLYFRCDEKSKNILQQCKEEDFGYDDSHSIQNINDMIAAHYIKRLNDNSNDFKMLINDYMNMKNRCHGINRKLSLIYKSKKRIQNEHDKLLIKEKSRHVCHFKIPKNSCFHPLRKILPQEFEWITNKNRLIQESVEMHHCVYTYDNDIKEDKCAIYSFIYKDGQRYTIEFRKRKNEYAIRQIQGKYNQYNQEAYEYVLGILEDYYQKSNK